jgi:hypothetical protein
VVAFLGGLVLAALWYLPNREAVLKFPLGDADLIVWWVLLSLTIYFASLPSAPLANAVAAFSLAAALASTWYLAHADFVQRLALYGYGINDPRGRALRLDNPLTYLYYVRKLGNEHVSFVLFVLLVAVVLVAAVVAVRQQGSMGRAVRQIRTEGWAVLAWLGGAYTLLSLSIYQEGRAFTPVIPAVALIFGAGCCGSVAQCTMGLGRGGAVGAVQFAAVSYERSTGCFQPRPSVCPFGDKPASLRKDVHINCRTKAQPITATGSTRMFCNAWRRAVWRWAPTR